MTMKSENSNFQDAEEVEDSLKEFIDQIMKYYDYFKIDGTIIEKFEKKLNDSDTLLHVFEIIKNMFKNLMDNIINNKNEYLDCSDISVKNKKSKRKNFEKVLVNYEKEIKIHKKNENQWNEILLKNEKIINKLNKKLIFYKNEIKKKNLDIKNLKAGSNNLGIFNKKNLSQYKNFFKKNNYDSLLNGINLTKRNDNLKSKMNKSKKIKINSILSQDKTIKAIKPKNLIQSKMKNKSKLNIKNSKSFNNYIHNKKENSNNFSKILNLK